MSDTTTPAPCASAKIPELPGVAGAPRKARVWYQAYQQRISNGLESCRECGATDGLTVERVKMDRPWRMHNSTILCPEHAREYFADLVPTGKRRHLASWRLGISSLYDEERRAEPDQRWGLNAIMAEREMGRSEA